MSLTPAQIISQSKAAYNQWKDLWIEHATNAAKFPQKKIQDFQGIGGGRACLLIANGGSLEKEIETIKELQGNVDIFVCDKALGHCLENGIIPTYCLVADAKVSYEQYLEPWKDQLKDTILFISVCANPKWIEGANWKDKYFYCVKDAIQTEKIFQDISKCPNIVAAGTNVSNSMVIFMTQCDNAARNNFFGYDKYLLIGFDYCWLPNGPYYAYDFEGGGKRFYMRHNYGRTIGGDPCYTSNNLGFSLQWLQTYIEVFKLPVIQCSKDSVLMTMTVHGGADDLRKHMQYRGSLKGEEVSQLLKKSREILETKRKIENELKEIGRRQFLDYAASL
jgi:hypothetical protein